MKPFLDLQLRTKLLILFGTVSLLFGAALWNAYTTMTGLMRAQSEAQAKQADSTAFAKMDAHRADTRVAGLMLMNTTEDAERQKIIARIREITAVNTELRRHLFERNRNDPGVLVRLQEYQALVLEFNNRRDEVIQLTLSGRIDEARQITFTEQDVRFANIRRLSEEMLKRVEQQTMEAVQRSGEAVEAAKRLYGIMGLGVAALVLLAVWGMGRMISDPLRDLVVAAQRISAGDLRAAVALDDRGDEIGQLARAFRLMTENLRTMQREVQEGVNVLASSASEIFTATAQIAAGATETATAVSQTTSTAEEVKHTAQLSAQKAGNVADIAQRAAQSAQTGRKSVDESMAGMQRIREQMELIAETVVRLSEQSQAIAEIISSVNDLAEQSNLLAVNASIEAAKAGEHGRGFAVVAQEIRSLANQSKESTQQIRTILNDIQRATSATVMAAEQGSKAVDVGVKQVNQSGDVIRTLAESIMAAAQAATQITASAQEQLIGIDQVAIAIQNILQASKQNATATQQAESGAKTLNQLGQSLKAVAQKFSV